MMFANYAAKHFQWKTQKRNRRGSAPEAYQVTSWQSLSGYGLLSVVQQRGRRTEEKNKNKKTEILKVNFQ